MALYNDLNTCLHLLKETKQIEKQIEENFNCLNRCKANVMSHENFINELSKYQFTYPDILKPLLSNVTEFVYGLKLKIQAVSTATAHCNFSNNLQTVLVNLIRIPTLHNEVQSYKDHISSYTNEVFFSLALKMLENDTESLADKEIFR